MGRLISLIVVVNLAMSSPAAFSAHKTDTAAPVSIRDLLESIEPVVRVTFVVLPDPALTQKHPGRDAN